MLGYLVLIQILFKFQGLVVSHSEVSHKYVKPQTMMWDFVNTTKSTSKPFKYKEISFMVYKDQQLNLVGSLYYANVHL